jgi:hypothetical protein
MLCEEKGSKCGRISRIEEEYWAYRLDIVFNDRLGGTKGRGIDLTFSKMETEFEVTQLV